jgi:hypothetical protein
MLNLPQPLTESQATVRASYWARKRTDEPDGFAIYFCEDEDAFYVVGYSQTEAPCLEDLELVDIVELTTPPSAEAIRLASITLDY